MLGLWKKIWSRLLFHHLVDCTSITCQLLSYYQWWELFYPLCSFEIYFFKPEEMRGSWRGPCTALSSQHTLFQPSGLLPNTQPPFSNSRLVARVARPLPELSVPKCMDPTHCQESMEEHCHSVPPPFSLLRMIIHLLFIHTDFEHLVDTTLYPKPVIIPENLDIHGMMTYLTQWSFNPCPPTSYIASHLPTPDHTLSHFIPNHTIHQSLSHQGYGYFQFIDFIMPTLLYLTSLDFQSMTSPFSLKLRPQGPALRSISFQYATFLWPLFLYKMLRVKLPTQMDETNCLPFLCMSWDTTKHYLWKICIFVRLTTS